jgi:PAS domain S-box-containing protein
MGAGASWLFRAAVAIAGLGLALLVLQPRPVRVLLADHFLPRGEVYRWEPGLVALNLVTDSLIGLSYIAISATLVYFVRRRRDLPFNGMFVAFGAFIIACGVTHLMEVVTLWYPVYWLAGVTKAVTAVASAATALLLPPLVPRALAVPGRSALVEANRRLQGEIAERRRMQDSLRGLIESAPDAMVITNEVGRIVRVNTQTERLFGYRREEMLGQHVEMLMPERHRSAHEGHRLLYTAAPVARPMHSGLELYGRRKDGSEFPVDVSLSPLDLQEEPLVASAIRDISERKRREAEHAELVREQARRTEAEAARRDAAFLAEASTVLAASLDEEETLRSIARLAVPHLADFCAIDTLGPDGRARRVAGAHVDPAVEREPAFADRRLPVGADGSDPVLDVLRTGRARHSRDGTSYIIVPMLARHRMLGTLSLVFEGSGRTHRDSDLGLAQDLARRAALAADNARLYEHARAANQAKDEFLATLSHELRTPLTAILGWTRMLQLGRLDAGRAGRALETIERNTRAQVKLVEDLLDLSRIVTGKLRLDIWTVDLPRVTEAAVESTRLAAEAKSIRIETALDPAAGPALGDPHRLQQVVWNLLSNALKFTPRGGLVQVRLARDGDEARLSVRDTGQGIAPAFLPYVFDPFRQGESAMTRTHGGLGLGLSIVRQLVELHGGRVKVESGGPGQGATFTIVLPLAAAWQPEPRAGSAPPAHGTGAVSARGFPALDGVRVLVVDDEPDTREVVATVLGGCGAAVVTAASAAEALAELERRRPDVLLGDLAMPGEDGFALIGRIRAAEADPARRLPAAALTAYARGEDRAAVLAAGFDMHIAKPIDPADLAQSVAELARRSRPVSG